MIEVKILVKFKDANIIDQTNVFEIVEGISNICDPLCAQVWNVKGVMEFERLSYEQNNDIKFKAVKKADKKEATA